MAQLNWRRAHRTRMPGDESWPSGMAGREGEGEGEREGRRKGGERGGARRMLRVRVGVRLVFP
jgi:hypothetical protein